MLEVVMLLRARNLLLNGNFSPQDKPSLYKKLVTAKFHQKTSTKVHEGKFVVARHQSPWRANPSSLHDFRKSGIGQKPGTKCWKTKSR